MIDIEKYANNDKIIIDFVNRYKRNKQLLEDYNSQYILLKHDDEEKPFVMKWYESKISKLEVENIKLEKILNAIKEVRKNGK